MLCCYIYRGATNLKKILSIDFSTSNCGYSFKENGKYYYGSIEGKGKTAWERTEWIAHNLIDLIDTYDLKGCHMIVEEPIIGRNQKGSITLANCNGLFIGLVHEHISSFEFVSNTKWCSFNLIKGKRLERKRESMELLINHLLKDVDEFEVCSDEADAYCQLLYKEAQ